MWIKLLLSLYFRDKCRQTVKLLVVGHGKRKRGGDEQGNRTQRHKGQEGLDIQST
jgi:hypothetical protein